MEVVIRQYSGKGAKELFELLEKNKADVEANLRGVQGLISYTLARSADGGVAVTVCEDQAAIEKSSQIAREWVAKNAAHIGADAPQSSYATVVVHV